MYINPALVTTALDYELQLDLGFLLIPCMTVGTPSFCGLVERTTGVGLLILVLMTLCGASQRMFDQCGPPPAYDGVPHPEALVVQAVDS
ncbi:hypothetical protein BD769DRAFT_1490632 [Suillus cothurnatus]|nr:hypothetical protein BD769DRAFT_1490632 [Suillus cothurnatus]